MEPSIPEFFAGRSILVTGATGFMGKVLVEKLLRSCPDLGMIYVLVRDKWGKTSQQRWEEITKLEMFDPLKNEKPGNLEKKVTVLNAEVQEERFGLADEKYEELRKYVSVVFHVAASVRFVEPIETAFKSNVVGTINVVEFASNAPNLKVLLHVSTAYSNCYTHDVKEEIYPPKADWKGMMNLIKNVDSESLNILTPKIIHPLVNTYLFTKHLAEQVINDARENIPVVIMRPSIVISAWKEPIPGWVDNENGPIGILIGTSKGAIRCQMTAVDVKPDYMAVDIAIKGLIVAAWKKGKSTNTKEKKEIDVYNVCSASKSITVKELYDIGMELQDRYPMKEMLWFPGTQFTKSTAVFRFSCFFKHFIPALIVDFLLKAMNKKPMLMKVQKKFFSAMMVLSYFMTRRWEFQNDNFINLTKEIQSGDKDAFDYSFDDLDPYAFFEVGMQQGQKFLLNSPKSDLPEARKRYKRMYWLDVIVKSAAMTFILYTLLTRIVFDCFNG